MVLRDDAFLDSLQSALSLLRIELHVFIEIESAANHILSEPNNAIAVQVERDVWHPALDLLPLELPLGLDVPVPRPLGWDLGGRVILNLDRSITMILVY